MLEVRKERTTFHDLTLRCDNLFLIYHEEYKAERQAIRSNKTYLREMIHVCPHGRAVFALSDTEIKGRNSHPGTGTFLEVFYLSRAGAVEFLDDDLIHQ